MFFTAVDTPGLLVAATAPEIILASCDSKTVSM
jgi:hypothetical protein